MAVIKQLELADYVLQKRMTSGHGGPRKGSKLAPQQRLAQTRPNQPLRNTRLKTPPPLTQLANAAARSACN